MQQTIENNIQEFFMGIGEFKDDVLRTDDERKTEFCDNGVQKFLANVVYPYQIKDTRNTLQKLIYGKSHIYQIPKTDALSRIVQEKYVDNEQSAKLIMDNLTKSSYPAFYDRKNNLRYKVNLKTNSLGKEVYEFEGIFPNLGGLFG